MGKTKVYYNSACPVCNAGINGQRRRMQACGVADVEWVDVHSRPDAVQEVGASLEQVRERLYVRDPQGRLNIGAEAIAELFSETPRQRWLGRLMRLRPSVCSYAGPTTASRAGCIAGIALTSAGEHTATGAMMNY